MRHRLVTIGVMPLIALLVFTGCATFGPPGPTMPALIGAGKTQAQFAMDDANCRQLATARAGDPAQVQQSQAVSTILGGLLGAAAGAAIGGATGGGRAAGIGAAIGGTAGTGIGLSTGSAQAQSDAARIQQRWDGEYIQCMYAAGHQVPGVAPAAQQQAPRAAPMPPPPPSPPASSGPTYTSPPPSGSPPAAGAPCKPSGKYVRTPQGTFAEICE